MKAATIPAVLLIALGIVGVGIGFIPFLGCITGIPMLLAGWAILGWAGFKAVKEENLDIVGGALAGLIAGLASSLVVGVINFVLGMLGIAAVAAMGSSDITGAALGGGLAIVGLVIGIVVGAVIGLVFGAIGALVAQQMAKK